MKWHYRMILHTIGTTTIMVSTGFMFYMFYSIIAYGYFRSYEHNPLVLYTEVAISIFSVAYAIYIFVQRFKTNLVVN